MTDTSPITAQDAAAHEHWVRWENARLDKLVAYQAEAVSKGKDYVNFIILAGFAAFFGLWAGVAKDIPVAPRLVTVGLMGVALLLFIGWELLVMHHRVQQTRRLGLAMAESKYPDDFAARWDAAVALNYADDLRIMRFWSWVFYPCCACGLAGGAILSGAAFAAALSG